jgi:predicted DNA-binding transcriptional regulator YafY
MKIDRLLGIVMILLQKDKVTAPYLAETFEVSRRTINRDIEALCMAGIPIITVQGGKGGISIAEGYRVEKSVLTYDEMETVVAALKGIGSISSEVETDQLINKFLINKNCVISPKDSIIIDLSSHYKSGLTDKISLIKQAIQSNFLIHFRYYSSKGEGIRFIEPYYITFQWSSWYVFGHDTDRKDFRLFKLNRLWELTITGEKYVPRSIPKERKDFGRYFTDEIMISVLFDESVKYRLIDEYGVDCYSVYDDGRLLLHMGFTNKDFLITWLLGFGSKAELLEPKELREEFKEISKNIFNIYQGT